ncbi:hypothetical protein GCM10022403_061820 [Streptomyces coacervatus]|uniref:Uncharacterized protein n=1 Tax=Streptomyces coacervatus TaxID=647381 RepID=A0ABP7IJG8_9ACTN|nr:hypothetical protein [Streptomyces coacervatus]MDF2269980.1 hypothetical protein [Streptomyces coacervatus]
MTAGQYGPTQPIFEPDLFRGGSHVPLISPWLQPHERLLGIVKVTLSDVIRPSLPRKLRTGQSTGVLGAVDGATEAVASVADAFDMFDFGIIRRIRRIVRGAGLKGGWQSVAGQFVIAVRTGPDPSRSGYDNDEVLMVFTDRRILLMCTVSIRNKKVPLFGKVPPGEKVSRREARCLGELLPGQLRSVAIRHNWLSNRVDLHFADGSLAALELYEKDARALEALSQGIVPPPRP